MGSNISRNQVAPTNVWRVQVAPRRQPVSRRHASRRHASNQVVPMAVAPPPCNPQVSG